LTTGPEQRDISPGAHQRVTFVAAGSAIEEIPATLSGCVDGILAPAMKRSKGELNEIGVRS
jgi:hypothetical protein